MRKHLVLALAVLSVATASFAAGQETGKVVSTDSTANTFTIETDLGNRIEFHTSTTTRMTRDEAVVGPADLVAGVRVRVTADDAVGSAPRHASSVELLAVAEPVAASDPAVDASTDASLDSQLARNDQLPSTATPLPLIALLGTGGVLAGLTLRRARS